MIREGSGPGTRARPLILVLTTGYFKPHAERSAAGAEVSMPSSETVTRGIRVQVESSYLPDRSRPDQGVWFFTYSIRIVNEGEETVQLLSRHWIITDAEGSKEEVRGPGVVGRQPTLAPGEAFEYSSFCPLGSPFGTMHGTYRMVTEAQEGFDVEIAPFSLSEPWAIN